MKHRAVWLPVAFLLLASISASNAGTLDPGLEAQMDVLAPGESITALVLMEAQAPIGELSRDLTRRGASRAERHDVIVRSLQGMTPTQDVLHEWLEEAMRTGEVDGYTIAVDVVDAGVGELVLVLDEGNSSRQIFGVDTGPIRATVVGIVDDADFGEFSIQGP